MPGLEVVSGLAVQDCCELLSQSFGRTFSSFCAEGCAQAGGLFKLAFLKSAKLLSRGLVRRTGFGPHLVALCFRLPFVAPGRLYPTLVWRLGLHV